MTAEPVAPRDPRRLIHLGIGAFLVTCVALFFFSGRVAPGSHSEPRFVVDETARPSPDGTFQVTLDTSDRKHWVHFDLSAGRVTTVAPGPASTISGGAPADLILRRNVLAAPHGALRLGKVPLLEARRAPGAVWVRDQETGSDVQNAALSRWYGYSYTTHALRSSGETYAVRLGRGGVAYLEVLSYYCKSVDGKPQGSGCMTIRYRLDLEGGG